DVVARRTQPAGVRDEMPAAIEDGRPLQRDRGRVAVPAGRQGGGGPGHEPVVAPVPVQPQLWPSFCCCSHSCSGAKYSSTAEASIRSPPVSSLSVCCQGWCEPCSSMARNFSPAALLP